MARCEIKGIDCQFTAMGCSIVEAASAYSKILEEHPELPGESAYYENVMLKEGLRKQSCPGEAPLLAAFLAEGKVGPFD